MSNFRKVSTLMVAIFVPVALGAQTPQQTTPAPQAAAQIPAANSGNSAVPKPSPSANSNHIVPPDNFYRPGARPQSSTPTPQPAAAPVTQPSVAIKPAMQAAPRTVVAQPAPVSVPEVRTPQPAPVVPAIINTPSPAAGATNAAVDYVSGQLSVVADNAPLGSVLKLIAAKTGATIDLAPEIQNEPVVARLGPSPVREVLTALLDSPKLDYIVLGGGDDGDKLQRVVVRMRHSFALFAASAPRPTPRVQEPQEQEQLDQDGHLPSGRTEANPQLLQQQRMANWQKAREAMRATEVKQQEQERENDRNASPDPPAPPQDNQPVEPPQNPPQDPPHR